MELRLFGSGDYDLAEATPPGTDTFQLELAPSGHVVLLCCKFSTAAGSQAAAEESLSFSRQRLPSRRVAASHQHRSSHRDCQHS